MKKIIPTFMFCSIISAGLASASTTDKFEPVCSVTVEDNRTVSISAREVPLSRVLQVLAEKYKRNIILASGADRTVSMTFYSVPFKSALKTIIEVNGLTYHEENLFIRIYSKEKTGAGTFTAQDTVGNSTSFSPASGTRAAMLPLNRVWEAATNALRSTRDISPGKSSFSAWLARRRLSLPSVTPFASGRNSSAGIVDSDEKEAGTMYKHLRKRVDREGSTAGESAEAREADKGNKVRAMRGSQDFPRARTNVDLQGAELRQINRIDAEARKRERHGDITGIVPMVTQSGEGNKTSKGEAILNKSVFSRVSLDRRNQSSEEGKAASNSNASSWRASRRALQKEIATESSLMSDNKPPRAKVRSGYTTTSRAFNRKVEKEEERSLNMILDLAP